MATGKKSKGVPMINRTVRFELHLSREQEQRFITLSQALVGPWNWVCDVYRAVGSLRRQQQDVVTRLSSRSDIDRAVDTVLGYRSEDVKTLPSLTTGVVQKLDTLLGRLPPVLEPYPGVISFNYALPEMTRRHSTWQGVPTDWQRQTIDMAVASWVSFFALRKNGDPHARPPGMAAVKRFLPISGCSSFTYKSGAIAFAPRLLGRDFNFPVPEYAQEKIEEALTTEKVGEHGVVTKFVIRRDNPNISQPGRYWCSVSYKYPAPEVSPVISPDGDARVYVALGASSLGVKTSSREEVINLWRPDKYWKEQIASVEERLKNPTLKKGSKQSQKLWGARRRMFEIMRLQQRQNHREVVRRLLAFGKHFVVPDYVVRSKPGKLADRKVEERGGSQGLNWAAQNTGGFLDLLMVLEERVREVGGSVTKVKLPPPPRDIGTGGANKIAMTEHIRRTFIGHS